MGARLVSLVFARWAPHIGDASFRVLMRMAHTALDDAQGDKPANRYFLGRDALADSLRQDRNGSRESAYRSVKKATTELVSKGAIRRVNKAKAGENQVYELTLWNAIRIDEPLVDNSAQGESNGYPLGDSEGYPVGTSQVSKRGTLRGTPRNQEEPLEELEEEISLDLRGSVTEAREDMASTKPIDIAAQACPNSECLLGYVIDPSLPKGKRTVRCPECNPAKVVLPFQRRSA